MTPEPSNEYQKLVEAVARAIVAADDEALLLRDGYPKRAAENFARAALSALSVSETAGRAQLKLPHTDDAADPSSSEVAAQPQPALPHAGDDGWNAAVEAAATKAAISVQYFRDTAVGNGLSVREARCAKNACADLERAIRRLALPTPPAVAMPIGDKVSWHNERFMMDCRFESRAQSNHYQSLRRLAERGGLVWSEAAAIIQNRKFERMGASEAKAIVLAAISEAKGTSHV